MDFITIENAGKKIKSTNYWDTEQAQAGKLYFSINAGCIRMLLPDIMWFIIPELLTGKKIIISRGPWPDQNRPDAFEIMFDDYSDSPYALHVGTEQWDMVPAKDTVGSQWDFAAWTRTRNVLHKKCYYRLVKEIPCLKPWKE